MLLSAPVETQVQCKADIIIIIIGSWHAPPKFPHAQERTVLKQKYGRQHDVYLARGGTANLREWRVRPNIYIFLRNNGCMMDTDAGAAKSVS